MLTRTMDIKNLIMVDILLEGVDELSALFVSEGLVQRVS